MHFVTGGSFNGKSKWVRRFYQLEENAHSWKCAYQGKSLGDPHNENIVVFEGIEAWLKERVIPLEQSVIREEWRTLLQGWLEWEKQNSQRKVILIGCDITKGIVPLSVEDRNWRDITGWVYQDLVEAAERVDVIWYGIGQKLK